MVRLSRKHALNLVAGAMGFVAFAIAVVRPVWVLVRHGFRPHGGLSEDLEFYYGVAATLLQEGGRALCLTLCILGMTLAMSSALGFRVSPAQRATSRTWLWSLPVFCFCLELLGRYLLQSWYKEHGLLFPFTSFLGVAWPRLCWLLGARLLTAPAIVTGRGLYLFRFRQPRRAGQRTA